MTNLFLPDEAVASFRDLDPAKLYASGIRLLLCDVDNTLSVLGDTGCSVEAAVFLISLQKAGIRPVLFTNNTKKHLESVFAGYPQIEASTFCCKPLPFSVRRVLKKAGVSKEQAAIFGDQLYTDMLAGKTAGIRTILSLPLSKQERPDTKIMRMLEAPIYARLEKEGKLKRGNDDVRIL